ncbi:dynamin family protein [Alicyclobacillus cycloheptanicus]|uniref:GTPase SAR1 family protein n=1 Tax=Alicyclobacillus cycloheptanicus TaxID=1457 RepID=A0ABT9XI34_9BACL|nr:dynamin family protein [Alicyclobacillus cycloheptanicus]MDQ0189966.1 GTPase SAR1 family protein [Alicyclobacillus cycloheptanicus]WDM00121.1 dynamin family protein [Alicyclobacillus cycloheptanicus]
MNHNQDGSAVPTDRGAVPTETEFASLLKRVDEAVAVLEGLPAAARWRAELVQLRARIAQRQRLVAVFGAFSAGKSSLLNAVLSDPLLAVSPNPTTAAVTQIEAQRQETDRPSARVTAKTVDQLWEDVREACLQVHIAPADLTEAMAQSQSLRIPDLPPQARRPAAFLKSVAAGYANMSDRLGTTWDIPVDELRTYTANEQVACFLQAVDVPHRAAILKDGFVLVDTPGVDSIHRRHTDVAFDYMRRADAIVFVLYYTHAFSRADKDFLLQLAGVQNVSESDKLFVVINAVDLAKSEEEREAVRDRVVAELRKAGIPRPRVFEVSSQVALAAELLKQNPDHPQYTQMARQRLRLAPDAPLPPVEAMLEQSGIPTFVNAMRTVTEENHLALAESAVERLIANTERQVRAYLTRVREQREADATQAAARQQACDALRQVLALRKQEIESGGSDWERSLQAEWETLAFHAGERIRLRFGELFREAFHPGRFRDEKRAREALEGAAEELAQTLERQVAAEVRTFAMRVERQAGEAVAQLGEQLQSQVIETAGESAAMAGSTPDFGAVTERGTQAAHVRVSAKAFSVGFHHYKSARQFFEGGGQQEMRAELEAVANEEVQRELRQAVQAIQAVASDLLRAQAVERLDEAATVLDAVAAPEAGIGDAELAAWERACAWFEGAKPAQTDV